MIENFNIPIESKATLVSLVNKKIAGHSSAKESAESLAELRELLRTLGVKAQSECVQVREEITPATLIGSGKLKEIAELAREEDSDFLAFDLELTAGQVKNIRKITKMEVVDRCSIILEIFASHAKTREAKIQIEISRLKYLLPRLTTLWSHLNRVRGGIGVRGGEGEQQLELDRRIIKEKIEFYKEKLEEIKVSRLQKNKKRQKNVITAALVGYTNAGKSSLMNRLCKVQVLEEDKLFATLDSTYRLLNPDTHPPMVMIDTVGLISNLPTTLISGFKTTLEAAIEADLIIIVCDISHESYEKHLSVTLEFLKELGIDHKDRFIVFNKKDQLKNELTAKLELRKKKDSFLISSFDDHDICSLRQHIIEFFLNKQNKYDLFIPYNEGLAHSKIMAQTNVVAEVHHQEGIYYKIRVPDFLFDQLGINKFILAPGKESEKWLENATTEIKRGRKY